MQPHDAMKHNLLGFFWEKFHENILYKTESLLFAVC